ncbi:MAG: hypothetical protein WCF36_18385 [Candidatus Nanopelagicales bacterium]
MTPTPTPLAWAGRPVVWVEAAPVPEVTARVLHLVVTHPVDGPGRCELVLDNWGPTDTGIGLVLSDRHLLDCGRTLTVELGGGTVFSGLVSAVEERYPADLPPRLVLHAHTRRTTGRPAAAPARGVVALTVGQELIQLSLVRRTSDRHLHITGTGTTPADARLHPGAVVHITGAAADLNTDYRITAVEHTFDTTTAGRSTIHIDHTDDGQP